MSNASIEAITGLLISIARMLHGRDGEKNVESDSATFNEIPINAIDHLHAASHNKS